MTPVKSQAKPVDSVGAAPANPLREWVFSTQRRKAAEEITSQANRTYSALTDVNLSEANLADLELRIASNRIPEGADFMEAMRKKRLDPPTKGFPSDLNSLDEFRRAALEKAEGVDKQQYGEIANQIERTINKQLQDEGFGTGAYSTFLKNQSEARQLAKTFEDRAAYTDQVQKALDKTSGSRAVRDKLRGNRDKLEETFGATWAKRITQQMDDTDKYTDIIDSVRSGKMISTDETVEEGLKLARKLGDRDNYVEALIKSKSDAASRVATAVGKTKTDFNDGVLSYLKSNLKKSAAAMESQGGIGGTGVQGAQTLEKMLGLNPNEVETAMSMLTPRNRDLVTSAVKAQQKIDQSGYFFKVNPNVSEAKKGASANYPFRVAMNSFFYPLGTVLDVALGKVTNTLSIGEQKALAKAFADNDPRAVRDLLVAAEKHMKPTSKGAGTYRDYIAKQTAIDVARALDNVLAPGNADRSQRERELSREKSSRGFQPSNRSSTSVSDFLRSQEPEPKKKSSVTDFLRSQ